MGQVDAAVLWKAIVFFLMKNQTHTFLFELFTKGLAVKSKKDVITQELQRTQQENHSVPLFLFFILQFTMRNLLINYTVHPPLWGVLKALESCCQSHLIPREVAQGTIRLHEAEWPNKPLCGPCFVWEINGQQELYP